MATKITVVGAISLTQQMDIIIDNLTGLFLTLLLLGWYKVEFETIAKGSEDVGNLFSYNPTYTL